MMFPYERDSELRTSYIVIRTFKQLSQLKLFNRNFDGTPQKNKPLRLSRNGLLLFL